MDPTMLYKCTGSGADPTPGFDCDLGCVDNGATKDDTCSTTPPDCTCKKAFDTCGSTFDPACRLDTSKIYKCSGSGATPVPDKNCDKGCEDKGVSNHDTCKPDCTCKKAFDSCGATFDPACKMDPTMLYKCTGSGADPTPGFDCDLGCVDNGATKHDTCSVTPPDCTCKKAFDTCGSTFDPACRLDASKVYKCSGSGAAPIPDKTCKDGCVDNGAGKHDTCKVDCNCKKAFDTCGATFDPSCGLSPTMLYKCTGSGTKPNPDKECTNGCVNNGPVAHDTCSPVPPDCTCKKAFDTCGATFDAGCRFEANKIYKCTGQGATPVPDKTCELGCVDNGATKADTCKVTPPDCSCKKAYDTCGSFFDPACGLSPIHVYKCTANGAKPVPGPECVNGCVENGATAHDTCKPTPPDCTCKKAFDTCGSTFDPVCGFVANKLYKCTSSGATPIPALDCVLKCIDNGPTRADICKENPPDCTCKKAFDTCGSSFDPACGYSKQHVYKCTSSGALPTPGPQCTNGCLENGATSHDTCKADCTCKKAFDTCGSTFDPSCKLDATRIYKCSSAGATPVPDANCANGCEDNGASRHDTCKTTPPDCTCKKAFDTCGSSFDPACGYSKQHVYKCTSSGALPTPGPQCTNGCLENGATSHDTCKADCTCKKAFDTCGSTFDPSCKLDATRIYKCSSTGATPVPDANCVNGCEDNGASRHDTCKTTPPDCTCKKAFDTCGSSFDPACKLSPSHVYKCTSSGAVPTPGPQCLNGCVDNGAGKHDTCKVDCSCKKAFDTCGSTFDPSCKLDASTLYKCTSAGAAPVPGPKCTNGCEDNGASRHDTCKLDCTCKKAFDTCGSTFDPACNLSPIHIYKCSSSGAVPVPDDKCANGCVDNGATAHDTCKTTPPDCSCKKGFDTCGSTFDPACKFEPNKIYKCSAAGVVPVPSVDCALGCVDRGAISHDICKVDCTCKKAFDTCGTSFDPSCGVSPIHIYKCSSEGAVPVPDRKCDYGCSDKGKTAHDSCNDAPIDCSCKKPFDTCGSTFDPACGFVAKKIYKCPTAGAEPVPDVDCALGCTDNGATAHDTCKADCSCKKAFDTCGSAFDATCGLSPTKLYKCSAAGAVPVPGADCLNGCTENGATAHDTCNAIPPDCTCKKGFDTCGSTFDPACRLEANKLYTCTSSGATPVPGVDCALGCVDNGATQADTCKIDCTCKDNFDTCGSAFNPACLKDPKTVYTCNGNGTEPVQKEVCQQICVEVLAADDECRCACTDDGTVCGSAFDPICKLEPNILYRCTNGSEPLFNEDCDPGICSANVVNGTAILSASGYFQAQALTDYCINQCACKEAGVPICSDAFPPECGFKNGTLFDCTGINVAPVVKKECTNGCIVQPGPDECRFDPCACRKTGDACGSSFPANCSYEFNTVYTCSGVDELPQKKNACESTEVCIIVEGGNDFCGKNEQCQCVGTGPVCAHEYPPDCQKAASTSFSCPENTAVPCPNGCAKGQCQTDCLCKQDGNICGSSFAPQCNLLPNAVYKCTNGQAPVLDGDCGMQACVESKCQDPCLCQNGHKACGTTFPDSCGFSKTALYTCTASGATPSLPEECVSSCELTVPDNRCIDLDCWCKDEGQYCGKTWPAKCKYGNDTIYSCPGPNKEPSVNSTCTENRCIQENKEARCMVDCELRIYAGIYAIAAAGGEDGAIFYYDLEKDMKYVQVHKDNSTGTAWAIGVNRNGTFVKANSGRGYFVTFENQLEEHPWIPTPTLDTGYAIEAYGTRKNGQFIYANSNLGGTLWTHADPPTTRTSTVKYSDMKGNEQVFCSAHGTCFVDLAYDGNDRMWSISPFGHLFISMEEQTNMQGGLMKYIGKIENELAGYTYGIAFDSFGYVYYGGFGGPGGYLLKAHMTSPLNTTIVGRDPLNNYGDLASCAYPITDVSALLV
ncbi:hypothetical protein BGZ94_007784 [Podila epigama]|nr:hypothetical protein BGZ94_007784 [Podila epigama]